MAPRSEQLEREADATRAQLQSTIEELRYRVTPGQILDQVLDLTGEGAATEFVNNLRDQVVRRPLAVMLMGAGLAWLMLPGRPRRAPAAPDEQDPAAGAQVESAEIGEMAVGPGARVREAARHILPGGRQRAADVRDRTAHLASEAVPPGYDEAGDFVAASHGPTAAASGVLGRVTAFCREQPLAVAGAGLVAGAVLGAVLARVVPRDGGSGAAEDEDLDDIEDAVAEQLDSVDSAPQQAYGAAMGAGDDGLARVSESLGIVPGEGPPLRSAGPAPDETPDGHG